MAKTNKRSMNGKGSYAAYRSRGKAFTNKVAKLERHIKNHPEDEGAVKALDKILANGYNGRTKPKHNHSRHDVYTGVAVTGKEVLRDKRIQENMGMESIETNMIVNGNRLSGRIKSSYKYLQKLSSQVRNAMKAASYEKEPTKAQKHIEERKSRRTMVQAISSALHS